MRRGLRGRGACARIGGVSETNQPIEHAMDFLVETSARHIHLTDAAIETLYGPGATLGVKKMLSQPGQFACTNDKIK